MKGGTYKSGRAAETELVNLFWDLGGAAIRVPGSGRSYQNPHPDVVGFLSGTSFAFQVKRTTNKENKVIYIEKKDIKDLIAFSKRAGTIPLVAAKFPYRKMRIQYPHKLKETEKSFKFRKDEGFSIDNLHEIVREAKN